MSVLLLEPLSVGQLLSGVSRLGTVFFITYIHILLEEFTQLQFFPRFRFISEPIHPVKPAFIHGVRLVIQHLTVINAEPADLAPQPHHFVNQSDSVSRQLRHSELTLLELLLVRVALYQLFYE